MAISENETLFNLIGTTYGGDGQSTFALPDLRGRVPLHFGSGTILAETGGVETVTLTTNQIPVHGHPMVGAATPGNQVSPSGNLPANSTSVKPYINEDPDGNFNAAAVGPSGGSQPHENLMPFLCIEFIISLFGIFPSPS
jgi:microcystin-dependent protein